MFEYIAAVFLLFIALALYKKLKTSEDKYKNIFESVKDAIYTTDGEGNLTSINQAGVEMLGYDSKEEVLGRNIVENLGADAEEIETFLSSLVKHGYISDYELRLKKKEGKIITVSTTSNIKRNANGRVIGFEGILRDVTERKKLEQQLIRSEKLALVGQLAASLAHEIGSPLTNASLYAQLLLKKARGEERKKLSIISEQVDAATNIVKW